LPDSQAKRSGLKNGYGVYLAGARLLLPLLLLLLLRPSLPDLLFQIAVGPSAPQASALFRGDLKTPPKAIDNVDLSL
jgi:hypothetical protein